MTRKPVLIVVDVQRDFCPGGALPVRDGDKVVAPIDELVSAFEEKGLPVVYTRDWHPPDHCSFASRGGPWAPHCVKHTKGAEFHPSLVVPKGATVVSKGTTKNLEAYSGFQGTDLEEILKGMNPSKLYVTGLATDYCVKNSVIDALGASFRVDVVTDCVRGVNVKRTDSANAFRTMLARGAGKTTSARLLEAVGRRVAVSSSS